MSKRFGRVQKASALVPLAVLSAAWTASLTGLGTGSAVATNTDQPDLPDGNVVPSLAVESPASVSDPATASRGGIRSVAAGDVTGIPGSALAAYQRAETIINRADPACRLSWQLIGAIGRVESDHGRADGNTLGPDGVATPGIFGVPLNGSDGTRAISDTDGGQYDADSRWDRAVGPMQFIPSTWSMVGVDADADGKRDPQDVHDAALASAVYLCSGNDDLSTAAGQRSAVFRYNHSTTYVNNVLMVMRNYLSGDFTSVPDNAVPADEVIQAAPRGAGAQRNRSASTREERRDAVSGNVSPVPTPSSAPSDDADDSAPESAPGSGRGGAERGSGQGTREQDEQPAPSPTPEVKTPVENTVKNTTEQTTKVVASVAELTTLCVRELTNAYGQAPTQAVQRCVDQLRGKTVPEATDAVAGVVDGLAGLVRDLLCGVTGLIGLKCPER